MASATRKGQEKNSRDFLKDKKDSQGLHAIEEFKQRSNTVNLQQTVPYQKVEKNGIPITYYSQLSLRLLIFPWRSWLMKLIGSM